MSVDPQTLAFYDSQATTYADYATEPRNHPRLTQFMDALRPGARVLDLGCGVGWAAAAMAQAGLEVTAQDASEGLAQEALARFGLAVIIAPFEALDARGIYDGIWCHFALQHAPAAARPDIFKRIARALGPGGLLYLGTQAEEVPWRDAHGRLYNPLPPPLLRTLATQAELEVERLETGEGTGFDGRKTRNAYLWARHA